jgi:hypothetical protein
MKTLRYNPIQRQLKKWYRKIFPVPTSPYTLGEVEDICAVTLVPPQDLQDFFKRALSILKGIKGDDVGDYLEFGVFNGASLVSMYKASKELDLSMRYFGFDAFEGLPAQAENEDDGVWKKGFYTCSFEKMKECLSREDIDPELIHWVKGWYDQTLTTETREKFEITNPGIVFIDCDTYSSSKAVLDFIEPMLGKPMILCFDDWKLFDLDIKGMGEYQSFNEFLENNPDVKYREIESYNRKSRSFVVWV